MKKTVIIIAFVVLAIAAGCILYIFNLKFADSKSEPNSFTVQSSTLIKEFEKDNNASNIKYAEKVMTVSGIVSDTEIADSTVNIKMEDSLTGNYIIFAFQKQYSGEAKQIQQGDYVSIKGSCSGGNYSEILESVSISFKRCTQMKNKNE